MGANISFSDGVSITIDSICCKPRYRRKKGNSLLMIPSDFTIVDIETTGTDTRWDSIIEVCCIKYRNNAEIERFSSLVQPPKNDCTHQFVDEFIMDYTGITNEMLSSAPKFEKIADSLWDFMRNELIVGHNVNFDINFLYDGFLKYNPDLVLRNDFVDTLRLARKALPELEHHRLEDLDTYFNIGNNHHRSDDDCLTTFSVLRKLADVISEKNIELNVKSYRANDIDMRYIKADSDSFDETHPLYGKNCVFTGALEKFSRKDAAQLVVNLGGHCENGVTKKTNFLIVGDFDYSSGIKDGKSNKMKKAEQLILKGQDLQILTEGTFCDMIIDSAQ